MNASVLIATMGFAGVVVGSALTYLIQWLMVKRQRSWVIEDSKVQHQRAIENEMRQQRYERLRQKVNVISLQVGVKTTALMDIEAYELGEPRLTKEQRGDVFKKVDAQEGEVQSALMAIGSEELLELHRSLNGHFYSARENLDLKEVNQAWGAAQAVHRKMEALLDEALVK